MNSGDLPPGSHHTQPKLGSRFLFQTQTTFLQLQGALKMIARLSSAVFYIITRKLLGAFYVEQKKKGLLPSTLPQEHEQWLTYVNINGLSSVTYPIAFKNVPLMAITSEADPAGWDNNINGIAIAGADLKTASNTRMNVLSKWIINDGTIRRDGQAVRLILMGI